MSKIDELSDDILRVIELVEAREVQGVKEKYEYNYLAKSLEKVLKVKASNLFDEEIFLPRLLAELSSEAKRTVKNNTALGAHRAAHKMIKITDKFMV